MELNFFKARRINPSRDGIDFEFWYLVDRDERQSPRRIHIVTKTYIAPMAWYMSQDQLNDFAEKVFATTVEFIREYWRRQHQLPQDDYQYYEGSEFPMIGSEKLNWSEFVLKL